MLEKIWPNELTQFILKLPEEILSIIAWWDFYFDDLELDEECWYTIEEMDKFLKDNLEEIGSYGWEWQWEEYWYVYKLSNGDYIRLNSFYTSWEWSEYQDAEQVYLHPDGTFKNIVPTQASADLFLSQAIWRIRDLWLEVKELSSYIQTSENQTT